MNDIITTFWSYKFYWKGVPCEAKDGLIFINGKQVKEFSNVINSYQDGDLFFIEGNNVTEIMNKYLPPFFAQNEIVKEISVVSSSVEEICNEPKQERVLINEKKTLPKKNIKKKARK